MKKIKTTLGERIGDVLNERKITQSELCRQTNTSTSSLNALITGQNKNPRIETLIPIAKGLGVSVDYLLGLDDVPTISAKNKAINKELGISDKAIENIKKINLYLENKLNDSIKNKCDPFDIDINKYEKKCFTSTLNTILENNDLQDFLYDVHRYLSISENKREHLYTSELANEAVTLNSDDLEAVYLHLINKHFISIKKSKK